MASGHDYTIINAEERFAERKIVRIDASRITSRTLQPKRIEVPFSGFNGQQLAGTGALVWEGELLQ